MNEPAISKEVRRSGPGVIEARPAAGAKAAAAAGITPLGLDGPRDGVLLVPKKYSGAQPAPLLVMLHGAGGSGRSALEIVREYAENQGVLVLSPDSRARTWDVIVDDYGPDVAFIDRALSRLFDGYSVDPHRIAVGGFSDGASYALSLGLTNGDLFSRVLAFSPGFMAPAGRSGSPKVFISHGDDDGVLPIDRCSRRLVPKLRASGVEVIYEEFDGPHTVPGRIAQQAITWFSENT